MNKTEGKIFPAEKSQLKRANGGYTIFECVILIVIISIILAGILPLFIDSISTNLYSQNYSRAYKIANAKIEEYRTASFDSLAVSPPDTTFSVPELPAGQGTLTVSAVDGNTSDIKKVDLTVSWNQNGTKHVRLVTYIAKFGIRK